MVRFFINDRLHLERIIFQLIYEWTSESTRLSKIRDNAVEMVVLYQFES